LDRKYADKMQDHPRDKLCEEKRILHSENVCSFCCSSMILGQLYQGWAEYVARRAKHEIRTEFWGEPSSKVVTWKAEKGMWKTELERILEK
jgi:hypothetical protein